MVKTIRLFSVVLLACSAFAQGTISLNNRTPGGDFRIYLPGMYDQGPGGVSIGATAQLFLVKGGGSLVPLFPTTTFRKSPVEETFFLEPVEVTVPNSPAGSSVTVLLRAWLGTESQPTCCWWGESQAITVVLGGELSGGQTRPPATLDGMWSFDILPLSPTLSFFNSVAVDQDDLRFSVYSWHGPPFDALVLESSADFQTWEPVGAGLLVTNSITLRTNLTVPVDLSTNGARFFRLSLKVPE